MLLLAVGSHESWGRCALAFAEFCFLVFLVRLAALEERWDAVECLGAVEHWDAALQLLELVQLDS